MLALGTAIGSPSEAVTMGVGAMLTGVAWRAGDGPLVPPIGTMAGAATALAAATLAGTLSGRWAWLHLLLLVVFCLVAGSAASLGRRGLVIGTQSVIAFIIFGRFPENVPHALGLTGVGARRRRRADAVRGHRGGAVRLAPPAKRAGGGLPRAGRLHRRRHTVVDPGGGGARSRRSGAGGTGAVRRSRPRRARRARRRGPPHPPRADRLQRVAGARAPHRSGARPGLGAGRRRCARAHP